MRRGRVINIRFFESSELPLIAATTSSDTLPVARRRRRNSISALNHPRTGAARKLMKPCTIPPSITEQSDHPLAKNVAASESPFPSWENAVGSTRVQESDTTDIQTSAHSTHFPGSPTKSLDLQKAAAVPGTFKTKKEIFVVMYIQRAIQQQKLWRKWDSSEPFLTQSVAGLISAVTMDTLIPNFNCIVVRLELTGQHYEFKLRRTDEEEELRS